MRLSPLCVLLRYEHGHALPNTDIGYIATIHFEKVVPWFQMLQRIQAINSWHDQTLTLET